MTNSISELKEKWWGVCQTQRIVKEEAIMIIDQAVAVTKKELVENIASAIEKYAHDNCSPYEEVYDLDFNKLAKAILDCIDKD